MKLTVSTAPHVHSHNSTRRIMLDVIIALLPAAGVGIYLFGYMAGLHVLIGMGAAVLVEYLWQKLTKQAVRVNDFSAALTGLLLALNMPVDAPLWVTAMGSVVAIILVKQLFGGIGGNFLNPALAARALLVASWPAHMTAFTAPTYFAATDAVSSATPLVTQYGYMELFMGRIPGTIGEVCKLAIIVGFLYLLIRGVITWHIPVLLLGTLAFCTWLFGGTDGAFTGDPLYAVLSGGAMFGAVFMATDYTTSPMTIKGEVIYAIGCGLLIALIREFGSYTEGVTYAILIMNIVTPLLDKYIGPNLYGEVKKRA
ncbi:MAG: RnfABCDGE type electron transport complex subunit D [Clostridia bacterium]|nr:RnfABCDGE type electron transport complex subunit D [Clostridia bacterium]